MTIGTEEKRGRTETGCCPKPICLRGEGGA